MPNRLRAVHIILWLVCEGQTGNNPIIVKYWEIIADRLSKAGWSWGCVSTINSKGQTIFVEDAHRGDRRRFIVHADEKLSAFVELDRQVLTVTFYLESIRAGERDSLPHGTWD